MKTAHKKYRSRLRKNFQHKLRHRIDMFKNLDYCVFLPFLPPPQLSAFEGFKKGEVTVLDPKTKTITKVK